MGKNKKVKINFLEKLILANDKPKKVIHFYYRTSLLIIITGIFLLPTIGYFSSINPEKIIELTNKERAATSLSPLTANQLLSRAAYLKAEAILESQSFQHNIGDKRFTGWIKESGYAYLFAGENLAIDFMTSEGIVNAWMNSPSHRENILNRDFSEIGVAIIEGKFQGQNSIIAVQTFGAPLVAPARQTPETSLPLVDFAQNENIIPSPSSQMMLIDSRPLVNHAVYNQVSLAMGGFVSALYFLPATLFIAMLAYVIFLYFLYIVKNIFYPRRMNLKIKI